ncbi:MAG: hypothetical protein RSG77_09905 [Hafnia sp.]
MSTDDPLEAEILDMLSDIKSSHRKQERLRSLLKGGYNLFYKNMSADMAMVEAFDKQDVALILSLFGGASASDSPQAPKRPQAPAQANPDLVLEKTVQPARQIPEATIVPEPSRENLPKPSLSKPVEAPPLKHNPGAYKEVAPLLIEDEPIELADFDPSLLELESSESAEDTKTFVDPLKRILNK